MKTYVPKRGDVQQQWYHVDATDKNLGRLASDIARVLKGKHKPQYTTNDDVGDFVVVTNAGRVYFTGNKAENKIYYRHSGYPGGLKSMTLGQMLRQHPERVLEQAVRGMLPKNRLGDAMYRKLKVYAGANHPHAAQSPRDLGDVFVNQPSGAHYSRGGEE
ncbi:MAG TPA: 50S ribosomal protein L13 [Chloroflexota bacterium]